MLLLTFAELRRVVQFVTLDISKSGMLISGLSNDSAIGVEARIAASSFTQFVCPTAMTFDVDLERLIKQLANYDSCEPAKLYVDNGKMTVQVGNKEPELLALASATLDSLAFWDTGWLQFPDKFARETRRFLEYSTRRVKTVNFSIGKRLKVSCVKKSGVVHSIKTDVAQNTPPMKWMFGAGVVRTITHKGKAKLRSLSLNTNGAMRVETDFYGIFIQYFAAPFNL